MTVRRTSSGLVLFGRTLLAEAPKRRGIGLHTSVFQERTVCSRARAPLFAERAMAQFRVNKHFLRQQSSQSK